MAIIDQEMVEWHDTEYMWYNEDVNTTSIFMRFRSPSLSLHNVDRIHSLVCSLRPAPPSPTIIDVQSKLELDSAERSKAYLRATLLILNQSISPNEDLADPPVQLKKVTPGCGEGCFPRGAKLECVSNTGESRLTRSSSTQNRYVVSDRT